MAMKLVKKTGEYSIYLRGDQRYAVKDADSKPINGDEKARILVEENLIKVALPAEKPAEETVDSPDASAAEEESAEAAAEEPSGEEAPAGDGSESGEDK